MRGIVIKINDRGFGFLEPIDGSKDVFFYRGELTGAHFSDRLVGEMMEFDLVPSDRGPRAANVRIVEAAR